MNWSGQKDRVWRLRVAIIVFSFSPSFFFLFIGDDSDDGGPKLENFLANKFNIVKKKSVRINEYRFLRPINLASLRKRIGSNISLRLVVDFSYHWSTASFRISSRWKISRERDYLAARRIRKVTYSSAKIFGTFTNVPCLSPDFLSWLKNVEIYWIRYPRFFFFFFVLQLERNKFLPRIWKQDYFLRYVI